MRFLRTCWIYLLGGGFLFHALQPIPLYGQSTASSPQPLFTLKSAKESGIHFNNKVEDTPDHNILIYSNYYGGGGVGIGDFNNDQLPDIYFAGNLVKDQLYLNKGNLNFEEITDQAGIIDNGAWSSGVIVGDVNKDGWMDIYVTCELYDDKPLLRKNKLYINNQDNTFTESAEQYGVADSQRTRHATFLDYDNDGDLDLFLCNQPPNPGDYSPFYDTELLLEPYRIRLLELEGKKYIDVTEEVGLSRTGFPNSVIASDLNGDGWTDLYVANDFWVEDWLFLNNGNGSFTEKIHDHTKHISFSSMGVDAADINNDGELDMMVLDMVAEDNYRLKANMSGMDPDRFWKVVNDGGHYQYMFNTLHFNQGGARFSDIAQLANVASTDWSWSVLMADFDNDGWKDIHITNGLLRDIRNTDANKKFAKYVESNVFSYLQSKPDPNAQVSLWDIVDIKKTIEIVPSQKLSNYAFRNNGDLTFSKSMEDWGMTQETFSSGSAYADFDLDGDLDLVINHVNDIASVYENHSVDKLGKHFLRIQAVADEPHLSLLGTKIWLQGEEGIQFFEITTARGMYSCSEQLAHFGLGASEHVKAIVVRWTDGTYTQLTDIKADQTLSVVYSESAKEASSSIIEALIQPKEEDQSYLTYIPPSSSVSYLHKENEFDDYTYQVLLPHKMSTFGPHISEGDVNGDGLDDFYIGGSATYKGKLFLQQDDGQFTWSPCSAFDEDKRHEDMGSLFFDYDNDGDLDLYVSSGGNEFRPESDAYQDRLYINDGSGKFTKAVDVLPEVTISSSKIRASDVDKDGDLDLFVGGRHIPWAYPEAASSVLLINDGDHFRDATAMLAPALADIGMVNDAKWSDYNNDGWEDLILVGEWMPITILENREGQLTLVEAIDPLHQKTGWFFSIESADIDKDGDEDFVVGNLGLNYKYKASPKEPFEVYYYDFDENGSKDVVLTYYNFGIKFPLRGRSCSSQQVPILQQKFKTYDLFASSDVFEVYGEQSLENALHYEATDFASAYVENLGNGEFAWHPLPIQAQFSSVNDLLIDDFNNDDHLDILLAGNLYQAEVETARNDAGYGLMLVGDSKGNFRPIDKETSGFYVPYDVKSMASLKTKEGRYIVVGSNQAPLSIYVKGNPLTK